MGTDAVAVAAPDTLEAILRRDRAFVVGGLIGLTTLSWAYLFYDARCMAAGHSCCAITSADLRSWPGTDLLLLGLMWTIMMVAMMVPTAAPMALTFSAVNRRRRLLERPYVPTSIFLLGYLLSWTGFSIVVTLAQWGLHAAALLSPAMVSQSRCLTGAILIAAGGFQFTRAKEACLRHCRSPLSLLMADWRDGPGGALAMGLRYGVFCLGCCWALMLVLFVTGVMNLLWVGILSIFVLIEKLTPRRFAVRWIGGTLMLGWGVWIMTQMIR